MILIADDSPIIREKLTELFKSQPGIIILEPAVDGKDAMEKIIMFKPDILILDLSMPLASGFDVLGKMKENSPLTKSIILSNHTGDTLKRKAKDLGCYSFYDKSTDIDLLLSGVNQLLNTKVDDKELL